MPVDRTAGGRWGFGFLFHAPPADGVEVALTVRGTGPVKLRAMDGSDGLAALPGFQPRPANVGVARLSHLSELVCGGPHLHVVIRDLGVVVAFMATASAYAPTTTPGARSGGCHASRVTRHEAA